MPTRIDATFQNAQSITLDAFTPPAGAATPFKDATIRVGKDAFRVSFAGDGGVSVSFATTSFFHLFQGARKTAVREQIQALVRERSELGSLAADIGKVVAVTGFRDNVERMLCREKANISRAAGGKLAHYGFSDVRERAVPLINRAAEGRAGGAPVLTQQLINDYNESIGLPGTLDQASATIAFVRDNDRGAWPYNPALAAGISAQDQADWGAFLKGHDIDLFSKIRKARAEADGVKTTGWAGEIARQGLKGAVLDLVRKNLDPRVIRPNPDVNFVLNAVADAVIETVDTDFAGLDTAGIEARLREIVARHAPRGREDLAQAIFDNAATTAFWRQTSKLGLDFFKARGETVVFEWTKFDGAKTDGAELADKWWKRPDADVRDHAGVAVTNSEMRHLQGAKYAAKPGGGRVVRVEAISQADAERIVAEKAERLRALPKADLDAIVSDLKAGFRTMNADTFAATAQHIVDHLPVNVRAAWSAWSDSKREKVIENALSRLAERLNALTSPVAQAAMLSCLPEVFEAEFLCDAGIVRELENDRAYMEQANRPRAASARQLAERRLAGMDRGRGGEVFFASDTGRPNALGELLLGDGGDIAALVGELRDDFAAKMGIPPDEALRHPAFKTFLPRAAAAARGSFDVFLKSLDTVKRASDAKDALVARGDLRLPVDRLFARRGEWDLNRLVFNEAVAAQAADRAVDLDRLARNAAGLRAICEGAQDFTANVARQINPEDREGLRLTDAERARLEDAYLDRENSSVRAYRLSGSDAEFQKIGSEAGAILHKTAELVAALRAEAKGLPDDQFKSLVIDAVATRAKPVHGTVALAALAATRNGEPIPMNNGTTATERLQNFARALADRIWPDWGEAKRAAAVDMVAADGEWGHDDGNTSMRMFFTAYLKANPHVAAFLDRTVDGETVAGVMGYDRSALAPDDPLPYVLEQIGTYGQL